MDINDNLGKDETLLRQEDFAKSALALTDRRVLFKKEAPGAMSLEVIPLDAISFIGLVYRSFPVLLGLAVLFLVGAVGCGLSDSYSDYHQWTVPCVFIAVILVAVFFATRRVVFEIKGIGNAKIAILVKQAAKGKLIPFINATIHARHACEHPAE